MQNDTYYITYRPLNKDHTERKRNNSITKSETY